MFDNAIDDFHKKDPAFRNTKLIILEDTLWVNSLLKIDLIKQFLWKLLSSTTGYTKNAS